MIELDALLAALRVPPGLATAPLADTRAWLAARPPAERGLAAETALAARLPTVEPRLDAVLDVAALWLEASGAIVARRGGGLPPVPFAAAARFGAALARRLGAALAGGSLDRLALSAAHADLVVYLWRQIFLNPYAPLNLTRPWPVEPARAAPGDPGALLVASLEAPFDAPAGAAAGLWAAPVPLALRLAAALWLINLPEYGLTRALAARCLENTEVLCREAPALPFAPFATFADEVMASLFRASYAGDNTRAALSAAGDFVAGTMQRLHPRHRAPPPPRPRAGPHRIGYVSMSFRRHATSYYFANRIVCHDRARFHVTTFALGSRYDDVTALIEQGSDEHVTLPAGDVAAAARAIAGRGLDLLVFCDVGIYLPTYLLAGLALAPRQVANMGHAASTGLPTLSHYLGGDHEGPEAAAHYRETLIRLPHLGAAQLEPAAPDRPVTRADLGLPDGAVVLISTAHAMKHPPDRDALLMAILAAVPDAHLVLKPHFARESTDRRFDARLRAAAGRAGVADRVHIVGPFDRAADVVGLLALADVQLDTFPFGGWTTNLEALWSGLPTVTQEGALGRNRWGAKLLRDLGIEAGIAADERGYLEQAVRLASDAVLRGDLRARIAAGARARFFDGPAAQAAYEAALLELLR